MSSCMKLIMNQNNINSSKYPLRMINKLSTDRSKGLSRQNSGMGRGNIVNKF